MFRRTGAKVGIAGEIAEWLIKTITAKSAENQLR